MAGTGPEPTMRAARIEDIGELEALETIFPVADRISARSWKRFLTGKACVRVLECEGELCGARVVLFRSGARVARLYSLAVARQAQGRGLGAALLSDAETTALERGCDRLWLEVRASNSRAVSLYQRAGFCVITRRKAYYTDGEDALRMGKRLTALVGEAS